MEYRELIEREKKEVRSLVHTFDSIFRLKGKVSFRNLLLDIDKTEMSESDVLRRVRAMLEMTLIISRKNNPKAYMLLKDVAYYDSVLTVVRRYRAFSENLYIIDKEDIEYYDELIEDGVIDELEELNSLFINDTDTELHVFNVVCNNMLYYCEIPNLKHENRRKNETNHMIRIYAPSESKCEKLLEPTYSAFIAIVDNNGKLEITDKDVNISCACEDCKFFKEANGKVYNDGSKRTGCKWLNTNSCKEFKTRLNPEELLAAAMSIVYANNHKSDAVKVSKEYNNDSTDKVNTLSSNEDVTVYVKEFYNVIKEIRAEDVKMENTDDKKTITSPREHERKGHYVHYKSGKVVFRKGCTVNKGKEKTTYKVKVDKNTKDKYDNKNT